MYAFFEAISGKNIKIFKCLFANTLLELLCQITRHYYGRDRFHNIFSYNLHCVLNFSEFIPEIICLYTECNARTLPC